jgi:hypothetical protein
MTAIALVHILWLMLLPVGIYCVRGSYRLLGIAVILVALPAYCFLWYFWPFDFLFGPTSRVLARVEKAGWTVTLKQNPDVDFYHTDFTVVSPEGLTNSITYDADDNKWWSAGTSVESNRVYFYRNVLGKDSSPSYLDLKRRVFFSGHYRREEKLAESVVEGR